MVSQGKWLGFPNLARTSKRSEWTPLLWLNFRYNDQMPYDTVFCEPGAYNAWTNIGDVFGTVRHEEWISHRDPRLW